MGQLATDQQPADANVPVRLEQITQITTEVLGSMLDTEVATIEPLSDFSTSTNMVQATVFVEGNWQAELRIIATQELAKQIACAMFSTSVDDLSEEEVSDAFREIANVIGGNLKGVVESEVGGSCELSIPRVEDASEKLPETASYQSFRCFESAFHTVLIEN